MSTKIKQLTNKQVRVKDYTVLGKRLIHTHNKFQIFICKLFKIEPAVNYRYHISIKYFGATRLIPKDVITDSLGNVYTVIDENNRLARILNHTPLKSKPNLFGVLNIEGREIQEQEK